MLRDGVVPLASVAVIFRYRFFMDPSVLLPFVTASLVLAIAPGPDNLFVLTQSAMYGWQAGIMIVLGLCTGLLAHTAAVVAGVAVLIQTSDLAFTALKVAGALYLMYLAWQAFRAGASELAAPAGRRSGIALYRRGIIMNVTNPKVSIFFLAFLPQFVNPAQGSVPLQLIALGFIFMLCALLVFGVIAFTAGQLGRLLVQSPRLQKLLNRLAGAVFLVLALKLVTSER